MGAVSFSLDNRLVQALKAVLPLEVFFESGTFHGDTLAAVLPDFAHLYSVELSEPLYLHCRQRFESASHVTLVNGDSAAALRDLHATLATRSVLYWLDAHWCVDSFTAGQTSQCPLIAELAAIGTLNPSSVVLIDDARLFLAPPPYPHEASQWPSLQEVLDVLRQLSTSHELMILNDVLIFYPVAGRASLVTFARAQGVDWLHIAQAQAREVEARRLLEEKEAAMRNLRQELEEANRRRLEAENTAQRVAADHEREPTQQREPGAPEKSADRLEAELIAKEAVINELKDALTAYRIAYGAPPIGVAFRVVRRMTRHARARARSALKPRLGNLSQYAPREVRLPLLPIISTPRDRLPSITVVTPSFNQGHFIRATIQSVLGQNYPALEYHVQDGGSTDTTVSILEKLDPRFASWVSERDQGQTQAINLGFGDTHGEVMAWINSDDLLLPGALDTVGDYFARHPDVDVVYGDRLLIDEEGREIGRWILPGHDSEVLSWADYIPQETLFWRRTAWNRIGGQLDESFRFAMDWDLLVRFRDAGLRVDHIPHFLGAFRIHAAQKTSAIINEVGLKEMDRIRSRTLGRSPDWLEVKRAIAPFLIRHVITDLRFRIRRKFQPLHRIDLSGTHVAPVGYLS